MAASSESLYFHRGGAASVDGDGGAAVTPRMCRLRVVCTVMASWWVLVLWLVAGAAAAGGRLPRTSHLATTTTTTQAPQPQPAASRLPPRNLTLSRSSVRNRYSNNTTTDYIVTLFRLYLPSLLYITQYYV